MYFQLHKLDYANLFGDVIGTLRYNKNITDIYRIKLILTFCIRVTVMVNVHTLICYSELLNNLEEMYYIDS